MDRGAAFSLIELLVVLAIVALLLGLLLPALARFRNHGREVRCEAQLRSIGIAVEAYRHDEEGRYPLADVSPYTLASHVPEYGPLPMVLEPYLRRDDPAYRCPGDMDEEGQVFAHVAAKGFAATSYNYWGGAIYTGGVVDDAWLEAHGLMWDHLGVASQTESYYSAPFHDNDCILYPDGRVERVKRED